MNGTISSEGKKDLLERGFTRRHMARMAGMLGAAAAMPLEFAMAQRSMTRGPMPADAVRISSNENPLGPCPEALQAIYDIASKGGRYSPNNESGEFIRTVSGLEELKPDYVSPYAGSSDPLYRAVCAFVTPAKGVVMGDPGYEAAASAAKFLGAPVKRVPLKKDYSHDVKAMLAADPNAAIYYICNPNNPTGTLTPMSELEWLVANKPKGSILLLDEAYIHFSPATSGVPMVAADKDVIVLRTFSKAFGMAGLRAGLALGRPDLIEKMRPYGSGMLPITGIAGASASLKVKTLVPERRKINRDIRENVFAFLEQKKFSYVQSESNKFMLQVNRPGLEVVKAMADQHVYIGRVWPVWPTYVRVSIGTQDDMDKFKTALLKVMA